MAKIKITTGFAYLEDAQKRIRAKLILPPGEHPLSAAYEDCTLVNVADEATLDALTVVTMLTPEEQAFKQQYEARSAKRESARQVLANINLEEATTIVALKGKLRILVDSVADIMADLR